MQISTITTALQQNIKYFRVQIMSGFLLLLAVLLLVYGLMLRLLILFEALIYIF
jgi:hypothetical protein